MDALFKLKYSLSSASRLLRKAREITQIQYSIVADYEKALALAKSWNRKEKKSSSKKGLDETTVLELGAF